MICKQIYVSCDGIQFEYEADCLNHEREYIEANGASGVFMFDENMEETKDINKADIIIFDSKVSGDDAFDFDSFFYTFGVNYTLNGRTDDEYRIFVERRVVDKAIMGFAKKKGKKPWFSEVSDDFVNWKRMSHFYPKIDQLIDQINQPIKPEEETQ